MGENLVITIGRQCGSRGRVIGMELAEAMGVKCYDKEPLSKAVKKNGLCEELFETHDEKPTSSFLYSLVMDTCPLGYITSVCMDMSINHKVFLAQSDTIKKLAKEESCVIVGCCGDYVLVNYPGLVSVFIIGDEQDKIGHLKELYDTSEPKTKDIMTRTDKKRASYYNYYVSRRWGDARSCNLCTDSSSTGTGGAIHVIQEFVRVKQEHLNSLKAE